MHQEKFDLQQKLAEAIVEAERLRADLADSERKLAKVIAEAEGSGSAEPGKTRNKLNGKVYFSISEAERGYYHAIFASKSGNDNLIDASELVDVFNCIRARRNVTQAYVDRYARLSW